MIRTILVVLVLFAITLALFWPVDQYTFITLDDDIYVTDNAAVTSGLTRAGVKWAFTHVVANNWHPITTMSLMLDATLFRDWAGGFHITNALLHTINAALLFVVLQYMTGSFRCSALVAGLFAWHPLHVESVAWISSRKDVLSAFFFLLALFAYARYARKPQRSGFAMVGVLYLLGLMAKPILVTLPFVLLLLDYWPLGRLRLGQAIPESKFQSGSFKSLVLEKMPLFGLTIIFSLIAFAAQGSAVTSLHQIPFRVRLLNVPVDYIRYCKKLLWPTDLAVFYPYPIATNLWLVTCSALLLLAMTAVTLRAGKRYPYLPVGWFWFLVMLLPVIGIVQVGGQAIADRYTYLSLTGLFVILAWGTFDLIRSLTSRGWVEVLPGCAGLISCLFATNSELKHWKDSETLFSSTLARTGPNWLAHVSLGRAFTNKGRIVEAVEQFEAALVIDPDNPDAHNNLANALLQKHDLPEAVRHYRLALSARPDFPIAHNNLGAALAQEGKIDEAMEEFQAALRLSPDYQGARENLEKAAALKSGLGR